MTHEFDDERPTHVHSLDAVTLDLLREETVVLPRDGEVPPPTEWGWDLSTSLLSFRKGADAVYRGTFRGEDVQVRVYPDRYTVQFDHANPVERPIRHLLLDVPPTLRVALLGGVGIGLLLAAGISVWLAT